MCVSSPYAWHAEMLCMQTCRGWKKRSFISRLKQGLTSAKFETMYLTLFALGLFSLALSLLGSAFHGVRSPLHRTKLKPRLRMDLVTHYGTDPAPTAYISLNSYPYILFCLFSPLFFIVQRKFQCPQGETLLWRFVYTLQKLSLFSIRPFLLSNILYD